MAYPKTIPTIKIDKLNEKTLELDKKAHTVKFFIRDGELKCCDPLAINYYSTKIIQVGNDIQEVDAGLWIHPELEKWAEKRGCYWEWDNPECIALSH